VDNKFLTHRSYVNTARWLRRAVSVMAVAALIAIPNGSAKADSPDFVLHKVDRGDVVRTVQERGAVEAANAAELVCRVRTRYAIPGRPVTTIKWIVEDGTTVKKGDKLVELDDSVLQEEMRAQQAIVAQQRARVVQEKTALKQAELNGQRDVEAAKRYVEESRLNLKRSDAQRSLHEKRLKVRVLRAERALELAKLDAAETNNKDRAKLLIQIAEADLEEARLELQLHQDGNSTEKRKLELSLQGAEEKLKEWTTTAESQTKEAESRLDAATAALKADEATLDERKDQVQRCTIVAPQDGIAVYSVSRSSRAQSVIAVGEPVAEGQRLLHMPDLRSLRVHTRVHEAMIGLVRKGQKAQVRVDAFNRVLAGEVSAVAAVAEPADWFTSDVKVYSVSVDLQGAPDSLKPGMTASVSIVVDQRKNVLRVPVQAVVREKGKAVCFIKGARGAEKRELTVGLSDDRYAEIKEGLSEGDEVILNPPATRERERPKDREGKTAPADPTTIVVRSVKPPPADMPPRTFVVSYGITQADYKRLAELPGVVRVVPMRMFPHEVRHREKVSDARIVGTVAEFQTTGKLELVAGRFLSDKDNHNLENVAVLGSTVAQKLFGIADPLGQTVTVGKNLYKVIGVVKQRGPAQIGQAKEDANSDIYIPLNTCNARFGETIFIRQAGARTGEKVQLSRVLVTVAKLDQLAETAGAIRKLLDGSHKQKDWEVIVPESSDGKK
jgi:HlyD family secretion protein